MDGQSEVTTLATTDKTVNAGTLMRQATDVAGVCREIVTRTAQSISGRKYVKVEGWQSIAVAYGCVASSRGVEKVEGGIRAIGEVRRMTDGAVIATAEGFVGKDETTWYGGKDKYGKEQPARPEYAIRAMAQTRAISRACRSAFAFVVTMIDGSLSTTPAEEMDGLDVTPPPASRPAASRTVDAPARQAAQAPRPATNGSGPTHFPNYGRAKATAIAGASLDTLQFYKSGAERSLADPAKSNFHAKERALLEAIEAEIAAQTGGTQPHDNDGPPPHTDSDAF
jgi:hypothetical protein